MLQEIEDVRRVNGFLSENSIALQIDLVELQQGLSKFMDTSAPSPVRIHIYHIFRDLDHGRPCYVPRTFLRRPNVRF